MINTVHLYHRDNGEIQCGWCNVRDGVQYDGRVIVKPGGTFAGVSYKNLANMSNGPHELDLSKGKEHTSNSLVDTPISIPELVKLGEWLRGQGVMPGYGNIYVNGDKVWYEGGDGDEEDFEKIVKHNISLLNGVGEVTYESEARPKDEGWVRVYPENMS